MPTRPANPGSSVMLVATIAVIVAAAAVVGTVGADARWLAALGDVIMRSHSVPDGVPFAAAASPHWANPLVAAELTFAELERAVGDRGLLLAQLGALGAGLLVLTRDARGGGANTPGICAALLLLAAGAFTSLAIVRVQLFSILMFPVLVALLRADARNPSRLVWLVVPLLALWSNLHGAAILGLGLTLCYLAFSRFAAGRLSAVALGIASVLSLALTPALAGTAGYYKGLLTNLAAERGVGMWGPVSPGSPLDLLLMLSAAVLLAFAWRARPRLWEWLVIAALAVLTVTGSRSGVWLLMFLAPLAARSINPRRTWSALAAPVLAVSVIGLALALARGPNSSGASPALVADALSLSHGKPVLAEDQMAEQVAVAGGCIWAGNPLDAFSHTVQGEYLDWLEGTASGGRALRPAVRVVLVQPGSKAQRLMRRTSGFRLASADRTGELYERVARSS